MKNILSRWLKRCIFFTLDEYERLIKNLIGDDVGIYVDDFTELYYESSEDEDEGISFSEIKAALEKHFDIKITSIHIDGDEPIGVWIAYKETLSGMVENAKQVLIDNGIEENKAEEVLQEIALNLTI